MLIFKKKKKNNFKYFKYKTRLTRNRDVDGANGILRSATIVVLLK